MFDEITWVLVGQLCTSPVWMHVGKWAMLKACIDIITTQSEEKAITKACSGFAAFSATVNDIHLMRLASL